MNILSLFDGMSCGMLALKRAGIPVTNYFASEIDKYAIQVSQKNFPEIIRLGDVTKVKGADLPKIDMIIGGSPCQGFSMAGKMLGHDDPRSKLFWEFKRLVDECKPKYFLLENVRMKKEDENIITEAMGIRPIMINSAKVSAQNRKRLYWTNIHAEPGDLFGGLVCHILQPKDRHLFLKDIVETEIPEKYFLKPEQNCDYRTDEGLRIRENGKAGTLKARATEDAYGVGMIITHSLQQRNGKGKGGKGHLKKNDGKSYACDTVNGQAIEQYSTIRRLTPVECERLQTVPDNYTYGVSEHQRYKMLGNAWTVDVIAHIFSYLPGKYR